MASKKQIPSIHSTPADSTKAVDAFMRTLDHAFKKEIEAIRASILGVDKTIAEGVKWNAPSFRTTEYFATIHLRQKSGVGVILHLGAKARAVPPQGLSVDDPAKLLTWLGKDRALVAFESLADFKAKKAAFERVVRRWITYV